MKIFINMVTYDASDKTIHYMLQNWTSIAFLKGLKNDYL